MEYLGLEEMLKNKKPQPRLLKEMAPVMKKNCGGDGETAIYDVYRNIMNIPRENLRYDITIIYPSPLCGEKAKTYGHYHKGNDVEITEIISGNALYLLQKRGPSDDIIKECYLAEVKKGEKIIFPPFFGHITINPSKEKLITCNWISEKTEADYQPYTNLHGACYYVMTGAENSKINFEKNTHYTEIPELIKLIPKEIPELDIMFGTTLNLLKKNPEKLDFLNNPSKYEKIITIENCYKKI